MTTINEIIGAVGVSLNAEFGDDYTIYSEPIEQGLKEPCFFISVINRERNVFPNGRYLFANQMCVQYFPQSRDEPKEECNAVSERLWGCLEYVSVDGCLWRGKDMHCETVDGVLNFFVNYDVLGQRIPENIPMEDLKGKYGAKG